MEIKFDGSGVETVREMEIPPREGEIIFLDDDLYYVVSVMWRDPAKPDGQDVTVELSRN